MVLENAAKRLRVAYNDQQVQARLEAMLVGLGADIDCESLSAMWKDDEDLGKSLEECGLQDYVAPVTKYLQWNRRTFSEYEEFKKRLNDTGQGSRDEVNCAFRELLGQWFFKKIVVISDFHATGNQIIKRIVDETPPGYFNRIMGLQNIKGTGLDFVYCWQKWERCHKACNQLRSGDASQIEQGLRDLSSFYDYGVLSEEFVREAVETVKHSPEAQTEKIQAELIMIGSNLANAMVEVNAQQSLEFSAGWPLKLVEAVEAMLDAGDAIQRRKTANQIYRDLIDERISHERAAAEMQALIKRQKGGWLFSQFSELTARLKKRMLEKKGAKGNG